MYIRNHNLVPSFDEDFEEEFQLEMGIARGLEGKDERFKGKTLKNYSLKDIMSFGKTHVVTTYIACAGNRRKQTRAVYPSVKGLSWDVGAIGNSKWKGVFIKDLLIDSGFTEEDIQSGLFNGKHLIATGLDADFQGEPYSISIPIERALDYQYEVLLAYEMNDDKIPPDHGYPLRLIVPGYIGVRNCKWVCKLEISDEEAHSHMQRRDYKWVEEEDWSKINLSDYNSINGGYSYAIIASPADKEEVKVQENQYIITIKGYATGNGEKGTQATNVQVSMDEGKTWTNTQLTHVERKPHSSNIYSWTLWKYDIDISNIALSGSEVIKPMVRAVDSQGVIQNGKWENQFNARGLLNTAPHQININIQRQ